MIMSETSKTYVFQPESNSGSNNSGIMSMIAPLLANKGIDSTALAAMMNNNGGFGGNGMWVIFLFFLMGWGGGWGGNRNGNSTDFLSAQMNNDTGRQLLQQAISGNSTAISQLASTLNVDISAIQSAICNLGTSVQSVANQVGMSSQQVINAVQSGNCQIVNQMAQSACDIKSSITTQGYENRLANLEQTNILGSKIDQQTTLLNEKFCELKERELQNKIDSLESSNTQLQNQISNLNQNAVVAQMIANATTPITSALGTMQTEVSAIKGAIPSTVTIPSYLAYQYGLIGSGTGSLWS